MSVPSRPHRRLSLTLPAAVAPPAAKPPRHEAPEEPPPRPRETSLLTVREPGPPRARAGCAGPPGVARSRLSLTQPTGVPPSEAAVPELLLRTDVPMHKRVLPKDAAILAQATSEAETLRMGDRGEKPRRRLHLTLPSGLAGAQPLPGESAGVDRVEITFFLPKAVISALEEEWWRRQCLGEDASRSDIVRVAVQEVLSHPDLLTKALRQAANQP